MSVPPTIFIVDDNPIAQETLRTLLATESYQFISFDDGKSLIAQRDICPVPDLVLLDVVMPDIDGFEICRLLRSDERLKNVPVILITALNDPVSRRKGFDAGADNIISKPFDRQALRAVIRAVLRKKYPYLTNVLPSVAAGTGKIPGELL
jgi:putative two-component system response regulator